MSSVHTGYVEPLDLGSRSLGSYGISDEHWLIYQVRPLRHLLIKAPIFLPQNILNLCPDILRRGSLKVYLTSSWKTSQQPPAINLRQAQKSPAGWNKNWMKTNMKWKEKKFSNGKCIQYSKPTIILFFLDIVFEIFNIFYYLWKFEPFWPTSSARQTFP